MNGSECVNPCYTSVKGDKTLHICPGVIKVNVKSHPGDQSREEDSQYQNNIEILDSPDPEHPMAQEKGVYEYRNGNDPLGLPLRGLLGRQIFVLVASVSPIETEAEIEALVMEYIQRGNKINSSNWAVDGFEIMVEK